VKNGYKAVIIHRGCLPFFLLLFIIKKIRRRTPAGSPYPRPRVIFFFIILNNNKKKLEAGGLGLHYRKNKILFFL
jgi:hypothetical protein